MAPGPRGGIYGMMREESIIQFGWCPQLLNQNWETRDKCCLHSFGFYVSAQALIHQDKHFHQAGQLIR